MSSQPISTKDSTQAINTTSVLTNCRTPVAIGARKAVLDLVKAIAREQARHDAITR